MKFKKNPIIYNYLSAITFCSDLESKPSKFECWFQQNFDNNMILLCKKKTMLQIILKFVSVLKINDYNLQL